MNKPTKLPTVEQAVRARMSNADKWRPALIAFYEKDEAPTKAQFLRNGAPLDYLDLRTIAALEAAFLVAAVNA